MENNMPQFLKNKLESQYGKVITTEIINGYKQDRYTTFRVNTIKATVEEVEEVLKKEKIEYEKVKWSKEAFIIKNKKESDLIKLEIYEEGKIYMQSLSSMLPVIVLGVKEGKDILDMTAAPGGKTTQMAAISNNKAHITACEMNPIRAERLKYNVEKQRAKCVYIMVKDSRRIEDFFSFDQILLDAPCSGSGTLNLNDKNINKYFSEKLIEKSIKAQKILLKKAIKLLKNGEEMVYSTCSILKEENEEVIDEVLREGNVEVVGIDFEGIPELPVKIEGVKCIKPDKYYEGFFMAKLRKIK